MQTPSQNANVCAGKASAEMRWWVQGGVCCTGVLLVCAVLLSYLTLPPSEADPNPSEWDSVFTRRASRSAEGAPTESSALDRLAHARAAAWAALASPSEAFDGLDELFAAQNGTGEEGSAVGLVPEVPPSLDDLDGLVGSGGGGGGDSVGIQSFGMGGVASWGLDRIDQASGLDSRSYEPAYDGAGTHVFMCAPQHNPNPSPNPKRSPYARPRVRARALAAPPPRTRRRAASHPSSAHLGAALRRTARRRTACRCCRLAPTAARSTIPPPCPARSPPPLPALPFLAHRARRPASTRACTPTRSSPAASASARPARPTRARPACPEATRRMRTGMARMSRARCAARRATPRHAVPSAASPLQLTVVSAR